MKYFAIIAGVTAAVLVLVIVLLRGGNVSKSGELPKSPVRGSVPSRVEVPPSNSRISQQVKVLEPETIEQRVNVKK